MRRISALMLAATMATMVAANAQRFDEAALKKSVDFLASDAMRGRSTPSNELDSAAQYLAEGLQACGIRPAAGDSYRQPMPFCATDLDTAGCRFAIGDRCFALKSDYLPLRQTSSTQAAGPLVFAGYGITAPEYGYDDYEGADVRGKIVIVMTGEPQKNVIGARFNGTHATPHAAIDRKLANAVAHGAAAVLLVTDLANHTAPTLPVTDWINLYLDAAKARPYYRPCNGDSAVVPAIQIGRSVVETLFGSLDSLRRLQQAIDSDLQPRTFGLAAPQAELAMAVERKVRSSANVVGWIEGSDPELRNEYIIVGAHYDHIGMDIRPDRNNDSIRNGADDNASGTAAVLAIARAFTTAKRAPHRSLVFIFFTAEEDGMIGSEYYTNHPLFPLERTVAMLNLDMVGRNGDELLRIEGADYAPDLYDLANAAAPSCGLRNVAGSDNRDFYRQSDNYPFYQRGIPALMFTSGMHADYHRPSDNPDRINPTKIRKIARLAWNVADRIARSRRYFTIAKP